MVPSASECDLRLECPRCGHEAVDEFEVIDAGAPASWRCGACGKSFSVLLTECEACGGESVDVALQSNEHRTLEALRCRDCGSSVMRHEYACDQGDLG
jgi:transcription elongation factor Elf1